MEFFESLIPVGIVLLCLAGIVALVALAYLFITLVKVVKGAVVKVEPMIDDALEIVTKVKPVVDKVDPLMDRATLTIDAVNLEIMRIDQILEDVNSVSTNVSKATGSLDAIASEPLDIIGTVTGKIRDRIAPHASSDTSVGCFVDAVDTGLEAVGEKVSDLQDQSEVRKIEREAKYEARCATLERTNEISANLKSAAAIQANKTASSVTEEK